MCGINGIFLRNRDNQLSRRISKMNEALLHRGPDAGNFVIVSEERIALGHRRLSIIDLDDRSAQPMASASGRWLLSYNGEIYNFRDIKPKMNYPYKTRSDTEVLLACLECFGIDELLKICNGMFAFAAYDTWEKELYLCRDRLGIKPLYYYCDADKLVFSSEIKGILKSGLVEAALDEESVDDYLGYRYVREPYTFFKNILQVKAGTCLHIKKDRQIVEKRYWEIPESFNMEEKYNQGRIKRGLEEQLRAAVLQRTVADVPLGTYLSGGIDSSLLTAMVAQKAKERVNTYTIGFPQLNEFDYSQMVADQYQTLHHKIFMSRENYLDEMQSVISYKDAPLGVPNEVPLAVMSKELKKDITVVLSGEGADELMGGYGRIFRSPFDYGNSPQQRDFYDYFIKKYEYVPRDFRDAFLSVSLNRRSEFDSIIRSKFADRENEYNVFYFFHKYHVKGLLQRVDTTTMLASVEARVPFLDHKLVEYVYENVPYQLKLRWKNEQARKDAERKNAGDYSEVLDTPKYLLRQIARDYLPDAVVDRKKMGFPVPLKQWNEDLKALFLREDMEFKWLCRHTPEKLAEKCGQMTGGSQILWMFLNVELFIRMYFSKEWRW